MDKEWQAVVIACCEPDAPSNPAAERLRLLEAVAAAAQANTRLRHSLMTMRFAEYLARRGKLMGDQERMLLEALAALETNEAQAIRAWGDALTALETHEESHEVKEPL